MSEATKLKPVIVVPSGTRIHPDLMPKLSERGITVLTELSI